MKNARLALLALGFLSACGGGGESSTPPPEARSVAALYVIGNSLTLHGPLPSIGWSGNWAMAASTESAGFPQVAAAALGVPVTTTNAADIEREPGSASTRASALAAPVTDRHVVVIQLGENASSPEAFRPAYAATLAAVRHARVTVCVSTWWTKPALDAVLQQACEAAGGRWVYVGDLRLSPANPDAATTQFADPGVAQHPGDWGMARIAERIVAAARR